MLIGFFHCLYIKGSDILKYSDFRITWEILQVSIVSVYWRQYCNCFRRALKNTLHLDVFQFEVAFFSLIWAIIFIKLLNSYLKLLICFHHFTYFFPRFNWQNKHKCVEVGQEKHGQQDARDVIWRPSLCHNREHNLPVFRYDAIGTEFNQLIFLGTCLKQKPLAIRPVIRETIKYGVLNERQKLGPFSILYRF